MEVRRFLLAAYPAWEPHVQEDPDNPGALLVRVPAPADPDRTLNVSTADDELTVAFDMWHAHFGWAGQSVAEVVADARAFIDDLLAERVAVAVKLAGGKWAGSAAVSPEDLAAEPDAWSYVRSWRGSHDRGRGDAESRRAPDRGGE